MDKRGTVRKDDDIEKHWPYKITGLSGKLNNVLVMIEQVTEEYLLWICQLSEGLYA